MPNIVICVMINNRVYSNIELCFNARFHQLTIILVFLIRILKLKKDKE